MHADARKLLWDVRQAAERVARFTHGKTLPEYQADELLRSAVERQLEIVGEYLNHLRRVDASTAAGIPELPGCYVSRGPNMMMVIPSRDTPTPIQSVIVGTESTAGTVDRVGQSRPRAL